MKLWLQILIISILVVIFLIISIINFYYKRKDKEKNTFYRCDSCNSKSCFLNNKEDKSDQKTK